MHKPNRNFERNDYDVSDVDLRPTRLTKGQKEQLNEPADTASMMSDALYIWRAQLMRLLKISNDRELAPHEIKNLDVITKMIFALEKQATPEDVGSMSKEELLDFARKAIETENKAAKGKPRGPQAKKNKGE